MGTRGQNAIVSQTHQSLQLLRIKVGKQNGNLKPETLQALMLYYCNSNLVNNGTIRLPLSAYLSMGDGDSGEIIEAEDE